MLICLSVSYGPIAPNAIIVFHAVQRRKTWPCFNINLLCPLMLHGFHSIIPTRLHAPTIRHPENDEWHIRYCLVQLGSNPLLEPIFTQFSYATWRHWRIWASESALDREFSCDDVILPESILLTELSSGKYILWTKEKKCPMTLRMP